MMKEPKLVAFLCEQNQIFTGLLRRKIELDAKYMYYVYAITISQVSFRKWWKYDKITQLTGYLLFHELTIFIVNK